MATDRNTLRALQASGLLTLTTSFSLFLSMSIISVPILLKAPVPLILTQKHTQGEIGSKLLPRLTLLSSAIFTFLGYSSWRAGYHKHVTQGYLGTAGIALLGLGFTAFIVPTNRILMARVKRVQELRVQGRLAEEEYVSLLEGRATGKSEEEAEVETREEIMSTHALVDRWGMLNLGRAAIVGVAAVVGTFTALMHPV